MKFLQRTTMILIGLTAYTGFSQVTWVVTNLSDDIATPASLRWTINEAAENDIINFDLALSGDTIDVVNGEMLIERNISIIAPAGGITLDPDKTSRIFYTDPHAVYLQEGYLIIQLTNLNLINANWIDNGGAIYCNPGTDLRINDCLFENNAVSSTDHYGTKAGGAIYGSHHCIFTIEQTIFKNNSIWSETSYGFGGAIQTNENSTLTINDCDFLDNRIYYDGLAAISYRGGAIYANRTDVIIDNSLFSNNQSMGGNNLGSGGAIDFNYCDYTIKNSQFIRNYADGLGGAIDAQNTSGNDQFIENCEISYNYAEIFGGGLALYEATVINCTVSNNVADYIGGGIFIKYGATINLYNSTIAFNSSTLYGSGVGKVIGSPGIDLRFENSIISDNTNTAGLPDDTNMSEAISLGHNIIGDNSGAGIVPTTGDHFDVDPLLLPLANNGGQSRTHSFECGSDAFEGGVDGLLLTDNRGVGFDRSYGTTTDIGAHEYQVAPPVITSITDNTLCSGESVEIFFTGEEDGPVVMMVHNVDMGTFPVTLFTSPYSMPIPDGIFTITTLSSTSCFEGIIDADPVVIVAPCPPAAASEPSADMQSGMQMNLVTKVYPNPTSTNLTIQIEDENTYQIQLMNTQGQIVINETVNRTKTLNMESLSSGIYTLIFSNASGEQLKHEKVVITH